MTTALSPTPDHPGGFPGTLARVEVFDSFSAAEPCWRSLERDGAAMTPYQGFDFLSQWHRHAGAPEGITPFIAVGFDRAGKPLLLLPLGIRTVAGLRVAEYLGGKHSNFNFPVLRRGSEFNKPGIDAMLPELSRLCDALLLGNQPESWHGVPNPLLLLPHQESPTPASSGALLADFETLMHERSSGNARKKMRKKAESLAKHGAVTFARAETPTSARRTLDTFFVQKRERMTAQGIPNIFNEAPVRAWLGDAVAGNTPSIEIYSLSAGDTIVATFAGMVADGRFSGMFNSADMRFAVESPGEQILNHLVRYCCERGLTRFDLGVGEARYKTMFCIDDEWLADSFVGLSAAGRMLAGIARLRASAKRTVKQTPALWSLVNAARSLRAR